MIDPVDALYQWGKYMRPDDGGLGFPSETIFADRKIKNYLPSEKYRGSLNPNVRGTETRSKRAPTSYTPELVLATERVMCRVSKESPEMYGILWMYFMRRMSVRAIAKQMHRGWDTIDRILGDGIKKVGSGLESQDGKVYPQ